MRNSTFWVMAGLAGAILGPAGAAILYFVPDPLGLAIVSGLICFFCFLALPWLVLPAAMVGGALAAVITGTQVAAGETWMVAATHIGAIAAGTAALTARRILGAPRRGRPVRTPADKPMLLLVIVVLIGALHGLAQDYRPADVLVAAYQVGIIPAYFFLATHTLTTPRRRAAAAITTVAGALALAAISLAGASTGADAEAGAGIGTARAGGTLSALALVVLAVVAARTSGWRRIGAAAGLVAFAADVVLSGTQAVWVSTVVALAVLLLWGSARLRVRLAVCALATVLLAAGAAVVSPELSGRMSTMTGELTQSAGAIGPGSAVGLRAFRESPIIGTGFGHSTTDNATPTFTPSSSGPVYSSFWTTLLANLGLLGLVALLWPLALAGRAGFRDRNGLPLAFAALACGFAIGGGLATPAGGHWELGLLPALTFLAVAAAPAQYLPRPRPEASPALQATTGRI
ncbi:O-antigen ligase family protein [Actinopolymorpha sp. B9G3]|uniref:O-antigen ligase family protein n=1 Tax=Actinopolymorpha sp. B9G3 TaxID=3158970 RepID=UPI0032D909F3